MNTHTSLSIATASFPAARLSAGTLRATVRAGLELACQEGLEPDLTHEPDGERLVVAARLSATELRYLKGLMTRQACRAPVTTAAARLAEAGMLRLQTPSLVSLQSVKEDALAGVLAALGLQREGRPEQRALFDSIVAALNGPTAEPIVVAQASTGVGKTAIALALARRWAGSAGHWSGVSVIACPTLNGIKAIAAQWHRARCADATLPNLAIVLGRREFVARGALEELLAEPGQYAPHLPATSLHAIARWAREQERIGPDELVRPWIMDSLLNTEGRLDREALAVRSTTPPDDAGAASYLEQFSAAAGARMIVCSHAMLATDVLLRKRASGRDETYREARSALREAYFSHPASAQRRANRAARLSSPSLNEALGRLLLDFERAGANDGGLQSRRLPPYDYLILDEAHGIEAAFSSAFSCTVSLRETLRNLARLRVEAWQGGAASLTRAHKTLAGVVTELTAVATDGAELAVHDPAEAATKARLALRAALAALDQVREPKDGAQIERGGWDALKRDRETLRLALMEGYGQKLLSFSPVRRYPHLTVGSGDVGAPLNVLWSAVKAGVLLSATLYLRKAGGFSARYQTSLLDVPSRRVVEVPVVEAPWVVQPVTAAFVPARVPRAGQPGLWLRPPSRGDGLRERTARAVKEAWLLEAADVLAWIVRTAAGGVIVPCTSHEMVKAIGERLQPLLPLDASLIVSSNMPSLGAMKEAALHSAAGGLRPVLVGTGGLWTGFDISGAAIDLPAERDNLVTDLAIPRLPFGMNRTLTHRRRVEDPRDSVPHEMLSAALLLQQGIGRLVRREGVRPNRRIFVLDGRLADPVFDAYLALCKRALEPYPQQVLRPEDISRKRATGRRQGESIEDRC